MPIAVNKDQKRKAIVIAAADVFALTGYHVATIQEIATHAGIGKGTVYEYFTSKEELFLAVYDDWMSEYEQTIRERVISAEDTLSKIDAIRDSTVEFYQSRAAQAPLLLEFWAHALRTNNPLFLERINSTRAFLHSLGTSLTTEMVQGGWFTQLDTQAFAILESGINDGIFLAWVLDGQKFALDKAYKFRQSLIGLGMLTNEARSVVKEKLATRLRKGLK